MCSIDLADYHGTLFGFSQISSGFTTSTTRLIFAHTQAMMRVLFCYPHLFKCGYMCPVMFALVVITRSDDSCVDLRRTVVNCLMIGAVAPTNVCADRWLLA